MDNTIHIRPCEKGETDVNPVIATSCFFSPPSSISSLRPTQTQKSAMSKETTSSTPYRDSSSQKTASIPEAVSHASAERLSPVLPIDWAPSIKYHVLFEVVAHAGIASWCTLASHPGLPIDVPVFPSVNRRNDVSRGAYTLMMGLGVLLWNPLADLYERRPILILSLSGSLFATCSVAKSKSYAEIVVAGIFQGFCICAPLSLEAAYVEEMFPPQNRGAAVGIRTLSITRGPSIAPFVSGKTLSAYTILSNLSHSFFFVPDLLPNIAIGRGSYS